MSLRWQSCPHCNAPSLAREGSKQDLHCPECGKPLAATEAVPTPAKWYYARNQQQVGPLSSAQLRELAAAGTLLPTDLVLRSGTEKWVAASRVKGLFTTAAAAPAVPAEPPPAASVATPPAARNFTSRHQLLSEAQVVPEPMNCVQCGMCSYNCPMGIDVRAHAWRGKPIHDSHCLTCGECVKRCPRNVLRFERIPLFGAK